MKKGFIFKSSSRGVSARDISRLFIPRTTTLRGDGIGVRAFTQNKVHSRKFLSGIPALLNKQRDSRLQISGMVSGFTLIELLVVVLIIGILASIALPQYQLAVKKAKATQNIVSANSMVTTLQAYYLANGAWPETWDDTGTTKPANCSTWSIESGTYYIACGSIYRIALSKGKISRRYCYADKNDTLANKLCKSLTGLSEPSPASNGQGNNNRYDYP